MIFAVEIFVTSVGTGVVVAMIGPWVDNAVKDLFVYWYIKQYILLLMSAYQILDFKTNRKKKLFLLIDHVKVNEISNYNTAKLTSIINKVVIEI